MEGAIHAVWELFHLHSDDSWGVLLVDAKNAFNSWLHYGMLVFFGHSVLASCLTHIVGMLDCLFKALISFC